jgi:hypothetical protein
MKAHWTLRSLALAVSVPAVLIGAVLSYEAILLGPLATPERIAAYRFGSESMIAHGGIAYASRVGYVLLTSVPALALVTSSATGIVVALRANRALSCNSLLCAIIATAVVFVVDG